MKTILRYLFSVLLFGMTSPLFSQTILNGDFENTTVTDCSYNMSNAMFNASIQDVYGFSTFEQLDIQTFDCYVDPQSGNWCVGIASAATYGTDALAMKLSSPLIENASYQLTFYTYGNTSFNPLVEPLEIGLSSDSTSLGINIYSDTVLADVWQLHTVTFVAPAGNLDFITATMVNTSMTYRTWVQLDSFALSTLCNDVADTVQISACDSLTWVDGNTYFASTNTPSFVYNDVITGGCDSTVYLDLTIIKSTEGVDTQTACYSYTWIDGNTYTSSNNTATFNLIGAAANGCDSIVTLNLTIDTVDVSVSQNHITLTADASEATFQWLDCNANYSMIESATDQSFTPTQNGSYAVSITQNGCTDTSDCFVINSVGIEKNEFEAGLTYYPNPTSGKFTIDLNNTYRSVEVKIFNATGQIIKVETFENTYQLNLEIEDVSSSLYFVEITTEDFQRGVIKVLRE